MRKTFYLLLVSLFVLGFSACDEVPNSPYSDPAVPDRKSPQTGFWAPSPWTQVNPHSGGVPADAAKQGPGSGKDFATGDESSIFATMPKQRRKDGADIGRTWVI